MVVQRDGTGPPDRAHRLRPTWRSFSMIRRTDGGCFRAGLLVALLFATPAFAADIDLTRATVVAPPGLAGPERQAVRMLVEEVARRSWVEWKTSESLPKD